MSRHIRLHVKNTSTANFRERWCWCMFGEERAPRQVAASPGVPHVGPPGRRTVRPSQTSGPHGTRQRADLSLRVIEQIEGGSKMCRQNGTQPRTIPSWRRLYVCRRGARESPQRRFAAPWRSHVRESMQTSNCPSKVCLRRSSASGAASCTDS